MQAHKEPLSLDKRLPTWRAVLEDFSAAPFRLFFLTGCLIGILAASCWTFAVLGWWWVATDSLNLHIFLFLQSLAGAVYAGFLFTAIPEWTHNDYGLEKFMQPLWCLCIMSLIIATSSLKWGLTLMTLYWLCVLLLATWLIWQKRDSRHLSILLFIGVTWLMTIYLALKAWRHELVSVDWQQLLHIEVMGIALISFRISKALGTQALEDDGQDDSLFIPNPFYRNLAVWLFYILVIVNLILGNTVVEGWLNLAIAGVMIGRLREWHFLVLLKRHYIRWLYLTLLCIGLGYAWRGVALIGIAQSPLLNPVLPFHLIAISGLILMIYQVFNIAGLRHSGRDLVFANTSRLALAFIVIAGLSRSLGVGLGGDYVLFAIYLPGALLNVAFLIYFVKFYSLFMRYPATSPAD